MAKKGRAMHRCKKIEAMREKCGKRQFLLQYQKRYVDLRISNNSSNKLLCAVFLSDSSQNTARNNLFEELFRGITLDDVFDDVTSTKTRNKVQVIKIADTLLACRQQRAIRSQRSFSVLSPIATACALTATPIHRGGY
jgi:hypothetical protein